MRMRETFRILLLAGLLALAGCGGGGGGGTPPGGNDPGGNNPGGNNPGGNNPGGDDPGDNEPKPDTTPDAIEISDVIALPGAVVVIPEFVVSGINQAVAVNVVNASYSLDGGETFKTDAGEVVAGQEMVLRVVAPSQFGETVAAKLNVGDLSVAFEVTAPEPEPLALESVSHKSLAFTWGGMPEGVVDHYELTANRGGDEGYDLVLADDISADQTNYTAEIVTWEAAVPNTRYLLAACDAQGHCVSWPGEPALEKEDSDATVAYLKAVPPLEGEAFGSALTLAAGELLVGVPEANNRDGALRRFRRDDNGNWQMIEIIQPPESGKRGTFGRAMATSADENWLLIGEPFYASNKGQAHVYRRFENDWQFHQTLEFIENEVASFSRSVAISADGSVLAIGAPLDDDLVSANAGSVTIYRRAESMAYVYEEALFLDDPTALNNHFGAAVALSADGNVLAVGVPNHDSDGANPGNDDLNNSGSVVIFRKNDSNWSREAIVKSVDRKEYDYFGKGLVLSADGRWLYVSSANGGIPGRPITGSVELFDGNAGWTFSQELLPADGSTALQYGASLVLSADGETLAVGDSTERGNGEGIHPPVRYSASQLPGAVHVFKRSEGVWSPYAYLKSLANDDRDRFGESLAISVDGRTIAVGVPREDGDGVNGPENNDIQDSGAIYIY